MGENVFVPLTRHLEHDGQREIACSPWAGVQVGVAGRSLVNGVGPDRSEKGERRPPGRQFSENGPAL